MRQEIQQMIEKLYKQYVNRKRWHKVVMALAAVVVFCTTYALVLPAITAETNCGIEEHTHEAVCYANEDIEGLLVCVLEEHTHVESCYQKEESEEISAINEDAVDTETPEDEIIEEVPEEPVEEPEEVPEEPVEEPEEIPEEPAEEPVEVPEEPAEDLEEVPEEPEEVVEEEKSEEVVEEETIEEDIIEEAEENIESETLLLNGVITTDEGDEITWELVPNSDETYTLVVSGNGVIPDNFVKNVPELGVINANNSVKGLLIGQGIISIGQHAFSDMISLEFVEVEEENILNDIGDFAFQNCPNLCELKNFDSITWIGRGAFSNSLSNLKQFDYTTNTFPALEGVDVDVFEGNRFEELTIGSLPLNNGIFGKSSDLKVVTFETKFDQTIDLFTDSLLNFEVIIGAEVDELYVANLKSISPYISSLHFEGTNYLTISNDSDSETGLREPLNDLSGNYYVDQYGVLYQLNDDDTAVLIYCPSGLKTYEALTMVPKKDGSGTYTVSSIDEHALTFATDLVSFDEKISKPKFTLGVKNSNSSEVDHRLVYSVDFEKETFDVLTIATKKTSSEDAVFTYYTGEMNETTVTVSPQGVPDMEHKVFRLYLKASDPGLEFKLQTQADGETVKFGDIEYKRIEFADGSYYIDLPASDGSNAYSLGLEFAYPSATTPGGTVQLWGAILDSEAAAIEATKLKNGEKTLSLGSVGTYHEMTWITSEDDFVVQKTAGETARIKASNGQAVISDLYFNISATRTNVSNQMQNKGENFITSFEYVDTMVLPTGVSWREGVIEAIIAENYQWNGKKIVVTLKDGESYVLAEYMLSPDSVAMKEFDVSIKDNNVQIHFIVENRKIDSDGNPTETDIPNIQLNIGNDILVANVEQLGESAKIINNVAMTPHYTFEKEKEPTKANAEANVMVGKGNLSLSKTHDRQSGTVYWGEDVNYTVTLKNENVFSASGYGKLIDTLNENTYIKTENLKKMFDEDTDKRLSVQIINATLYEKSTTKLTGTTVDGSTVDLKPQNTGADVENYYNGSFDRIDAEHMLSNGTATITIQWSESGELTMLVEDSTENINRSIVIGTSPYLTIEDALAEIGYTITSQSASKYICTWDLKGLDFPSEAIVEYEIPATIKNTFMLLGKDLYGYHNQFLYGRSFINNVILQDENGEEVENAATDSKSAQYELMLEKKAYSNGQSFEDGFSVQEGAVIDYTISVQHKGTGQYDVLPVVDHMQGGNILLAKVSDNPGLAGKDFPVEKIGEEDYYVINKAGVYHSVKLGEYLASEVEVKSSDKGLDTIIHWYFENTPNNAYTMNISYKALISRMYANIKTHYYQVNNEAWLNDHQSHRLYMPMNGEGTMIRADKKIVSETDERVVHSLLSSSDSEVEYELTLENVGNMPAVITGASIYDALPFTYSVFEWKKDVNVHIAYSGNAATENAEAWSIKKVSPENNTTTVGQFYICWDNEFNVTIPAREKLIITVKLQFPTGETWGTFFKACNGNLLYNSFYVYHMSTQVSHDLVGKSSAKLQKGVYDIGTMAYTVDEANKRAAPYVSNGTRHVYGNLGSRSNEVVYYVSIHNDGTNRLYLNDMIDTLPKGFRFLYVCAFAEIGVPSGLGKNGTLRDLTWNKDISFCTTENESNASTKYTNLSSIDSNEITYLKTQVRAKLEAGENGRNNLRIYFSGNSIPGDDLNSSRYDAERGQYYLKPNEAIRFGYVLDAGFTHATEDEAANMIMMPFTDYTGESVKISDLVVEASKLNKLKPNDGECMVLTDAQAAEYGNERQDGDTCNQWLASSVTVTRGKILPGIRKVAVNSNALLDAAIPWEIEVYNDGTATLNDYVVSDEIDKPYKFLGEVTYNIYAKGFNNSDGTPKPVIKSGTSSTDRLFYIESNDMDKGGSVWVVGYNGNEKHELNQANNYTAEIECAFLTWYDSKYYQNNMPLRVSFEIMENGNQRINIRFVSPVTYDPPIYKEYWGLTAGGYGRLSISTANQSGIYVNAPFNNYAWITPVGNFKEFSPTPVHGNYTSLDFEGVTYPSVVSSAHVNVSAGYFTSSEKRVKEINGTDDSNRATSISTINYIVLNEKASTFRYDLEVTTPTELNPSKFVLIDNLPEVNDHLTFGTALSRYSEFEVDFSQSPNISVTIIDANGENAVTLNENQYQIGYSTKTAFTVLDWNGTSTWTSDLSNFVQNGELTARSIRLLISDKSLLTANSKIILSFDAVIQDPAAMPGQTAWNSFGYHFELQPEGKSKVILEAAPDPVGIKFPSVPVLKKELIEQNGNSHITDEDVEFRFLVYKGASVRELESVNYGSAESVNRIRTLMALNNISQYFIQDVTVPEGSSSSERYILEPTTWYLYENGSWIEKSSIDQSWQWEDNEEYTLVELQTDNKEYEIDSIRNEGNDLSTVRSYPFVYHADRKENITAFNKYRTWELILSKADSEDRTKLLADAVFALYSPNSVDAELYSSETSDEDIVALKNLMGISTVGVNKQVQVGKTIYYLKDIIQIGSSGKYLWDDLTEETYILEELRAPNGYILNNRLNVVSRENDYHVEYTITNEAGYLLPDSGGIGVNGITTGGAVLMLAAAAGAIINSKKKSKNKRKVVSSDDSEGIKEAK